jgi:hypothetical protein
MTMILISQKKNIIYKIIFLMMIKNDVSDLLLLIQTTLGANKTLKFD